MNKKSLLSTPVWAYVIGFIVALICYFISFGFPEGTWYYELSKNLGFGVFASTLVAVFIDVGNTKVASQNEEYVFGMLTAELKNTCKDLPFALCICDVAEHVDDNKKTYSNWINDLFTENITQSQEQEILIFLQQVTDIKTVAMQLKETSKVYFANSNITEDFLKDLSRLISYCRRVERSAKEKKYNEVKKILLEEIKNIICELFPELSSDYTREYNIENYIEEE